MACAMVKGLRCTLLDSGLPMVSDLRGGVCGVMAGSEVGDVGGLAVEVGAAIEEDNLDVVASIVKVLKRGFFATCLRNDVNWLK